jgi:hypothetical protein
MSGIGLLFDTAFDYERTHQIAIYTLLKQSQLANLLQGQKNSWDILWEPESQLFDLGLENAHNNDKTYIELKMWSSLGNKQRMRQSDFLNNNEARGLYVLLGTSWFEISSENVTNFSNGLASKIGYVELIELLNQVIVSDNENMDVLELALSYRIYLENQYQHITNAYNGNARNKLFWYSLYDQIRGYIINTTGSIFSANNPGGEVYILNDDESWLFNNDNDVEVEIYFEVVNGTLCIKFHARTDDADEKRAIRNSIRISIHNVLDNEYNVVNAGRIGRYMTACQIEHDFSDVFDIENSATVFDDIHSAMQNIVNGI